MLRKEDTSRLRTLVAKRRRVRVALQEIGQVRLKKERGARKRGSVH